MKTIMAYGNLILRDQSKKTYFALPRLSGICATPREEAHVKQDLDLEPWASLFHAFRAWKSKKTTTPDC
jgi:hypothetical protein